MIQLNQKENIVLKLMIRGEKYYSKDILEMLRYQHEPIISTDLPWEVRGILRSLEEHGRLFYDEEYGSYSLT